MAWIKGKSSWNAKDWTEFVNDWNDEDVSVDSMVDKYDYADKHSLRNAVVQLRKRGYSLIRKTTIKIMHTVEEFEIDCNSTMTDDALMTKHHLKDRKAMLSKISWRRKCGR